MVGELRESGRLRAELGLWGVLDAGQRDGRRAKVWGDITVVKNNFHISELTRKQTLLLMGRQLPREFSVENHPAYHRVIKYFFPGDRLWKAVAERGTSGDAALGIAGAGGGWRGHSHPPPAPPSQDQKPAPEAGSKSKTRMEEGSIQGISTVPKSGVAAKARPRLAPALPPHSIAAC